MMCSSVVLATSGVNARAVTSPSNNASSALLVSAIDFPFRGGLAMTTITGRGRASSPAPEGAAFPFGRWQTGRIPRAAAPSGPGCVSSRRARRPDRLPPFHALLPPLRRASSDCAPPVTARAAWPLSRACTRAARAALNSPRQTGDRLADRCRNVMHRSRGVLSRLSRAGMARKPLNPGEKMIKPSG